MKIPVVIRLYPKEVQKADLIKELKIDRHNIDREILRQASKYIWWATLYAKVSEKVDSLQEKLDHEEAELSIRFYALKSKGVRVTEIKNVVRTHPNYIKLLRKLRHWKNSERILKFAEKGFTQRASMLQSYAANTRRERKVAEND